MNIIYEANAGTGKTTTLINIANENFDKNILYLVFNKDNRKVAKHKFTANVEVHTINSFAFKYSGIKKVKNKYSTFDIIKNIPHINLVYKANHISGIRLANNLLTEFNIYVNSMCEPTNSIKQLLSLLDIPDHSLLLKNFIETFDFSIFDYDILMIDEAQDLNPLALELIKKINATQTIIVGDPRQSIYGFRNNINIFQMDLGYEKRTLNKTYRFGVEIAEKVNEIFHSEIIGNELVDSKITTESNIGPGCVYITRTNAHLFDKAIEYALMGHNVSIPFNWDEVRELIRDTYYLKIGLLDLIKNPTIYQYKTFENFENLTKDGSDPEYKYLIKIINKHQLAVLEYIALLERKISSSKYADIVFITAHKSKGLEFLYVELGEDFSLKTTEEQNLTYVAMTRAKLELNISSLKFINR